MNAPGLSALTAAMLGGITACARSESPAPPTFDPFIVDVDLFDVGDPDGDRVRDYCLLDLEHVGPFRYARLCVISGASGLPLWEHNPGGEHLPGALGAATTTDVDADGHDDLVVGSVEPSGVRFAWISARTGVVLRESSFELDVPPAPEIQRTLLAASRTRIVFAPRGRRR